jgi:hypothetical protein
VTSVAEARSTARQAAGFSGRTDAWATRHGKLDEVAPALRSAPVVMVPASADTGQVGTCSAGFPPRRSDLDCLVAEPHPAMAARGSGPGKVSEGTCKPNRGRPRHDAVPGRPVPRSPSGALR